MGYEEKKEWRQWVHVHRDKGRGWLVEGVPVNRRLKRESSGNLFPFLKGHRGYGKER